MPIFFYQTNQPHGQFSNFYKAKFELDGKTWSTVEHYYQAMKFENHPQIQEEIRNIGWAGRTKKLANGKYRDYWEWKKWIKIRDEIMYKALRAKYLQNQKLEELLIGTGDEELVEHTKKDSYWGDGGDGSGKNKLGKMLMQLREEVRLKNYK